jgi:hypothetical protein
VTVFRATLHYGEGNLCDNGKWTTVKGRSTAHAYSALSMVVDMLVEHPGIKQCWYIKDVPSPSRATVLFIMYADD